MRVWISLVALLPLMASSPAPAAPVAQNPTAERPCHLAAALQNGVTTPDEIRAVIMHPAFHSTRENSRSAAGIARTFFAERGIQAEHPSLAVGDLVLLIDEFETGNGDAQGVRRKPGQRPDLASRDRDLVTTGARGATEE